MDETIKIEKPNIILYLPRTVKYFFFQLDIYSIER